MTERFKRRGRLLKAPENFVDDTLVSEISGKGLNSERRDFLRRSFLAASASMAAASSLASAATAEDRKSVV